jgi:serine/threonine-protein kinase
VSAFPLLDLSEARTDDVEALLRQVGEVFVVFRGHDSGNTSAGVLAEGRRWFVKWATKPEAVVHLRSAVRFHAAVRHPAVAALRNWFAIPSGLALVHDWVPGEVLNDPRAPRGLPRHDSRSAFSRFRRLPVAQILAAVSTVLDAHRVAARHGFVAVDFYDGCLIYDFRREILHLCDLDSYRPGPYVLDRDRQYGSTHFMAPEEFSRGAVIDERSTVFTLGRTALMLLSGPHGDRDPGLWRAGYRAYQVARTATEPDAAQRYQSVAEMAAAWHAATAE